MTVRESHTEYKPTRPPVVACCPLKVSKMMENAQPVQALRDSFRRDRVAANVSRKFAAPREKAGKVGRKRGRRCGTANSALGERTHVPAFRTTQFLVFLYFERAILLTSNATRDVVLHSAWTFKCMFDRHMSCVWLNGNK